jgi:hypothetical protein
LGAVKNVVYFNNPSFDKLAIYTEDFRETMMYLDLSKNSAVLGVIQRIGGGLNPARLALGTTRIYTATEITNWNMNGIADVAKNILLLTGKFSYPGNVAFFTEAKTEKNFSYEPIATTVKSAKGDLVTPDDDFNKSPSSGNVPRFVMVAPVYDPKVELTANTSMNWGYDDAKAELNKITLHIENGGNRPLYNPKITLTGADFFKVGGGSLQTEVDAALNGIKDPSGYIPVGKSFDLPIRIKLGRNPGKYDGWVRFSADNLPTAPQPKKFTVEVLRQRLPPPKVKVIEPVDGASTVNGSFKVQVDFVDKDDKLTPVDTFLPEHIFVQNGILSGLEKLSGTNISANFPTFYTSWTYEVKPKDGLKDGALIATYIKLGAATDTTRVEHTDGVSETLYLTYNTATPFANFSVTDNAELSRLDSVIITFSGNSKDPDRSDSVYYGAAGMSMGKKFTESGIEALLNSIIKVTKDGGALIAGTGYTFTVVDDNTVKIAAPPGGFPNGAYMLTILGDIVYNYEGNKMGAKTVTFTIKRPEIADYNVSIDPVTFPYEGGETIITIRGIYLNMAGSNLKIQFPPELDNMLVSIPPENINSDGTEATYTIELPPNRTISDIPYKFRVILMGRVDNIGNSDEEIDPLLTATVKKSTPQIDTSRDHGLFADPHDQSTDGGPVSLTVKGENLCLFQNLTIRVTRDGSADWTSIPVPTTPEFGETTITLHNAYLTEQNFDIEKVKYVFTLWHNDAGTDKEVTDVAIPPQSPIADTTLVQASDPAVYDLKVGMDPELTNPSHSVRMSSAGGEVYFVVDGINLDKLSQLTINGALADSALINTFEFEGIHGEKAYTKIAVTIPPNTDKGDREFMFSVTPGNYTVMVVQTQEGERIMRTVHFPEVAGATVSIPPGDFHLESRQDLIFTVYPTEENLDKTLVVTTNRDLPDGTQDVYITRQEDGSYQVRIPRIQSTIQLSIEFRSGNDDSSIGLVDDFEHSVWSDRGRIHIVSHHGGAANIYNASGRLVKVAQLSAGETVVTLPQGLYLIETGCGGKFKTVVR